MSDIAIRCENLSKRYRIGQRERYKALRDTLTEAMYAPFRKVRSMFQDGNGRPSNEDSTIWALRDVGFEIRRGEVIGIIGRNGAGKSTLLKILSRITEPTQGHAEIHGRVGSLLEVGTGFHPELTGRENVLLNGAILGMRKAEIDRQFDRIVSFAEIEKFLDTPVKHYSTGMYVRLAFAVAVHLEPEVLIIDEVLAVGDAEFQKKCFQKMQEIGKGDRTILLVSHNMSAVRSICQRALILDAGRLIEFGPVDTVVDDYLAKTSNGLSNQSQVETEMFIVRDVQIRSSNGPVIKTFDPVTIALRITAKTDVLEPDIYVGIETLDGHLLTALCCRDFCSVPRINAGQWLETEFCIDSLAFLPGKYQLKLHLVDVVGYKFDVVPTTFPFEIVESSIYGGRKIDRWFGHVGLNAEVIARVGSETSSASMAAIH